ncbi:hypothetical protein AYK25_04955 [Thermoplasmatales archaeon SM1-50]|nr:MAG: hypothetical protein AYK25_04955 [Thermoplasmatales archaeon SM1-50]
MNKKRKIAILLTVFFFLANHVIIVSTAADQDTAEQYAPILYFVDGEKCYPVNVTYAIYEVGNPIPLSMLPTAVMLKNYTSDVYYLDNQKGTIAVGDNGIENAYQNNTLVLDYTVYARVDPSNTFIQYWFFYAFNNGDLNRHEGDWEMVQVILSNGQPTDVMVSQHHTGQKAIWSQVDKEGSHVNVYVARGSHANYIKPYSGKIGLASDTVADNGLVLRSTQYNIEILDTQPWLDFAGRWGWIGNNESTAAQAEILGEAGPPGPKFRQEGSMWQPYVWASGLQPANDILFVLEWFYEELPFITTTVPKENE